MVMTVVSSHWILIRWILTKHLELFSLDGDIGLTVGAGGGLTVAGDDATANQTTNTAWEISLDNTVVRTSGDQAIGGNKDFNGIITAPVIGGNTQVAGTLTSKLKFQIGTTANEGNIDFSNLPDLSTAPYAIRQQSSRHYSREYSVPIDSSQCHHLLPRPRDQRERW